MGLVSLQFNPGAGRVDDLWPAFNAPATVTLGIIILLYITSAILHQTGADPGISRLTARLNSTTSVNLFLWPALALIPLWVAPALRWLAPGLAAPWIGVTVAALGLGYVWLGKALGRIKPAHRIPPQTLAYAMAAAGIVIALPDTWALFAALLLAVATLASEAVVKHRHAEAIAASLLFIWPFQIGLTQAGLAQQAQALAYALLGGLAYVPLGLAWLRGREADRTPRDVLAMLGIGYAMAAGAVIASLAGRYTLSWPDFPWVRVLTALVAAGLATFSVFRLRRREFAWAAVLLSGVAFGQMLDAANVPDAYLPVAWAALALVAVIVGYGADAARIPAWLRLFARPVNAGATAAGIIGLALTAAGTANALSGRPVEGFVPLILAQSIAVVAVIAAALLRHSSRLLYLEPFLAFFPVTLFFIGYGERLVGRPLAPVEYALVWTGLALIHLVVAAVVDRRPVRYARGLYLGGYAILLFAVLWSVSDRKVNLVVLGVAILVALASQILDHLGLHMAFQEFVGAVWRKPDSLGRRVGQLAFLFFAAFAIPVWLVQLLVVAGVPVAWRAFALAALAATYVALGVLLGRCPDGLPRALLHHRLRVERAGRAGGGQR